jgi:hypothetical protein
VSGAGAGPVDAGRAGEEAVDASAFDDGERRPVPHDHHDLAGVWGDHDELVVGSLRDPVPWLYAVAADQLADQLRQTGRVLDQPSGEGEGMAGAVDQLLCMRPPGVDRLGILHCRGQRLAELRTRHRVGNVDEKVVMDVRGVAALNVDADDISWYAAQRAREPRQGAGKIADPRAYLPQRHGVPLWVERPQPQAPSPALCDPASLVRISAVDQRCCGQENPARVDRVRLNRGAQAGTSGHGFHSSTVMSTQDRRMTPRR